MAARTLDCPGRDDESFVTSEVAARFLCVGKSTFLRMVGRKKGGRGAIPGVGEWLRPLGHGQGDLWDTLQIGILRHIIIMRQLAGEYVPSDDDDDEVPLESGGAAEKAKKS